MLKACSRCGKIHAKGDCSVAAPDITYKHNKQADYFRNQRKWKNKTNVIKERDYNCCRVCLSAGVVNCNELSVHHIIPLAINYDLRLDDSNLITLCRYHHEQAERGRISKKELTELANTTIDFSELNCVQVSPLP